MNVSYILAAIFVAALIQLIRWRKAGITIPRWVHVLAIFGFLLGSFIALIDSGVGAFGFWEALAMPLVFPALVYVLFVGHGHEVVEDSKDTLVAPGAKCSLSNEVSDVAQRR